MPQMSRFLDGSCQGKIACAAELQDQQGQWDCDECWSPRHERVCDMKVGCLLRLMSVASVVSVVGVVVATGEGDCAFAS